MGVVSLILKMISYIFEGVDTWFWKQKRKKERGGGGGRKISLNPTGTKVVFFSCFLFTFVFAFDVSSLVLEH